MKYLIILLSLISFSANGITLAEKTELSADDIAWINTHKADKTSGNYGEFTWIRLNGNVYSMHRKVITKACPSYNRDCIIKTITDNVTSQVNAEIEEFKKLQDDTNTALNLLVSKGFTPEEAITFIKIFMKR